MKNKMGCLLTGVLLGTVCLLHGEVDADVLSQKVQQQATQQLWGVKHVRYMRFFPASNLPPQEPGFWESLFSSPTRQTHIRALAIYLYNMHIVTASLHQSPHVLTLNHLGVLDGLVRGPEIFDTANAVEFYQDNKKEVDTQLTYFLKNSPFQTQKPTQGQVYIWLKMLSRQPRHAKRPVYLFPTENLLQGTLTAWHKTQLQKLLKAGLSHAQKQVVTYDVADVQLEDLDSKIGTHQPRRKRTYRWASEECYYSTYLIARILVDYLLQHKTLWDTRVYTLSAWPKTGAFLTPAQGKRFTLANGKTGLHWRYHTALLVLVPQQGTYVPVVLDTFLGGQNPLTLQEWLAHFERNTTFGAVPFMRDEKVDQSLKVPQRQQGNKVWVDGAAYDPAPVEQ